MIYRLIGYVSGTMAEYLGAEYVKSCLEADYRIKSVTFSEANIRGDVISIQARAEAIEGGIVDIIQGGG